MIIQHNIPALNAHRNMGVNNTSIAGNLEKLSSGFRINRAADDAAGLAISEKMRGQIRGLAMAEQNTSHGINLIQTAEGGLNETQDILQRMRELAVQSSNGTYQDDDRQQLALEFNALKSEIDRIAESTHYNGIKLLNGNLDDTTYTQRVKDVDDILLNAAFGTNTKAGDEFVIAMTTGAVQSVDRTQTTEVAKAATTSTFAYDLSNVFDADAAATMMRAAANTLTVNLKSASGAAFTVTLDRTDAAGVTGGTFTTNEQMIEKLVEKIQDEIDSNQGGYAKVSLKDGNLVFTATQAGTNAGFDAAEVVSIVAAGATGMVTTNPAGGTAGTHTMDDKIADSIVIGDNFGWQKSSFTFDFTNVNVAAKIVTGTKSIAADDQIWFEIGGKAFNMALDPDDFDVTSAATISKSFASAILNYLTTDETAIANLAELGAEVSLNAGGTGLIFTATDAGANATFDNLSITNLNYLDTSTAGTPAWITFTGVTAANRTSNATGATGQMDSKTIVIGKEYTVDDSLITINNKAIVSHNMNNKTNMLELVDEDGNTFTIDAARVKEGVEDEDGNDYVFEATVRAAGGQNLVFQIGANGGSDQRVYLGVANMSSFNLGLYTGDVKSNGVSATSDEEALLSTANITTVKDSNEAIDIIHASINQVSSQRAELGALQNRLESTLNSLGISKENLTAAESTIRDVDMAAEMMEFTKNSILVQAAQAMLAQANQLPQGVLQLLR